MMAIVKLGEEITVFLLSQYESTWLEYLDTWNEIDTNLSL